MEPSEVSHMLGNLLLLPMDQISVIMVVRKIKKHNHPWCEHCRRTNHTKDICWKIHENPADWKTSARSSHDSRGNVVAAAEDQPCTKPNPFNKEQMEVLRKLLQTTV